MTVQVKVGDVIIATDENAELTVTSILGREVSKVIDFDATYSEHCGFDRYGNKVYAGRGFSYSKNNWILKYCEINKL